MTHRRTITPPGNHRLGQLLRYPLVSAGIITLSLSLGVSLWWLNQSRRGTDSNATQVPPPAAALREIIGGVKAHETATLDSWATFTDTTHGFTIRHPHDWDLTPVPSPALGSDVTLARYHLSPRGKRYVREPRQYFPLTIEVIAGDDATVARRYPPEQTHATQPANISEHAVTIQLRDNQDVIYVFTNPATPTIRLILRDELRAITELGEEQSQLTDTVNTMIASLTFADKPTIRQ